MNLLFVFLDESGDPGDPDFLFTPSESSSGIQFADFATGAIARKFFAKDERYFERIKEIVEGIKT